MKKAPVAIQLTGYITAATEGGADKADTHTRSRQKNMNINSLVLLIPRPLV